MTDRKLGKIEISHDDFRRKVLGLGDEFRVVSVVDNFAGLSVIVESDELIAIPPGGVIPVIDLLYTDNGSVSWRLSNQAELLSLLDSKRGESCSRCGKPADCPTILPYGSKYERWVVCGKCVTELIDPAISAAAKSYNTMDDFIASLEDETE